MGDMTFDLANPDEAVGEEEKDYADDESDNGSIDSLGYSEDNCDDADYATMARFVPTLLLERLRTVGEATMVRRSSIGPDINPDVSDETNRPKVHELDAAVMVVDVSGFSRLSERFAQGLVPDEGWMHKTTIPSSLEVSRKGDGIRRSGAYDAGKVSSLFRLSNDEEIKGFGAEGVRDVLNQVLGALISTVEMHGGDVLRIAGDALIVLFHQGDVGISSAEFDDLCMACTRCGWDCATSSTGVGTGMSSRDTCDISNNGKGQQRGGTPDVMNALKVHVGIGCGRVSCFHVGSDQEGWQLVVSGDVFETQVAKAIDASKAGEVVVSAQVWQHLANHGWGSGPVEDNGKPSPPGFRLLYWTPDQGATAVLAGVNGEVESGGGGTMAPAAPAHGGSRGLALFPMYQQQSHSNDAAHRSSFTAGVVNTGGAMSGVMGPANHGRSVSLEASSGAMRNYGPRSSRWCPSRRRLALLEEVETGVLTMLSMDVRLALRGYCPQSIIEGLVAERMGLLAEIQKVSVLFIGLSFKKDGVKALPMEARVNGSSGLSQLANERNEGADTVEGVVSAKSVEKLRILQASFSLMQIVVARHGGVIKELSVDDKGTVLVVGFGLSPHVGRLPAARATLCAMECTERLRTKDLARCHAGIATGPVFCGSLGSKHRREFAMVSATVNLSQRLMSARKNRRLLSKTRATRVQRVLEIIAGNVHRNGFRGGRTTRVPFTARQQPPRSSGSSMTRASSDPTHQSNMPFLWASRGPSGPRGPAAARDRGNAHGGHAPMTLPPLVPNQHPPNRESPDAMPVTTPASHGGKPSAVGAGAVPPTAAGATELWEEVFNGWVVLESETLKEARKTDKLAFLELELIKVKGKEDKIQVFAPGMCSNAVAAISKSSPRSQAPELRGARIPSSHLNDAAVSLPPGIILGGVGSRAARVRDISADEEGTGGGVGVPKLLELARTESQEAAERYGLGSPEGCELFTGERKRGASMVIVSDNSDSDGEDDLGITSESLQRSVSLPSTISPSKRADPNPDTAAKVMGWWREHGRAPGKMRRSRLRNRVSNLGMSGRGDMPGMNEDVLSRKAFEELLPCIFHADTVHDTVSHILWARTGGRVSYLSDLSRNLVGMARRGTEWGGSFGDVGEDGMWRLRLNEFAHVLKLASRVPASVEDKIQRRLDMLPYTLRQVVLRAVCVTVVAGLGETELLLHLLTNVAHFKEYWKAVVQQQTNMEMRKRRRPSRRSNAPRRSASTSPAPSKRVSEGIAFTAAIAFAAEDGDVSAEVSPTSGFPPASVVTVDLGGGFDQGEGESVEALSPRRRAKSDVFRPMGSSGPISGFVNRPRSGTEGSSGSLGQSICLSPRKDGDSSVKGAGLKALLSCLKVLEKMGFLRVLEGGKTFVCDDLMLIDQVYASTPFKNRKALHKEAAEWISARHRQSFRDRAEVMPVLISHLTQAHEEGRAQAMLAVLKVLGGQFLDRWVLKHVQLMMVIRETPKNPKAMEHLARCVLPALPSLRGLSKAIRGAEIAGVVVGVAIRLRSLRLKQAESVAPTSTRHQRSVSITGATLKSTSKTFGDVWLKNRATSAVGVRRHMRSSIGGAHTSPPSDFRSMVSIATVGDSKTKERSEFPDKKSE